MTEALREKYGWEILADALLDAQLDLMVGVPGKPVTPTQDALYAAGAMRWVNHEATAAGLALGAAGLGSRTAVLVKQVGLNAAIDVLACASPHRSGGAVLFVVGDDPGSVDSQIEGDSRRMARAVELPCFEPGGVADIPIAVHAALDASMQLEAPAILRLTTQLMFARQAIAMSVVEPSKASAGPFDPRHWDTDLVGHRSLLLEKLFSLPENQAAYRRMGSGAIRVVAAGVGEIIAAEYDVDLLVIRRVFPGPVTAVADFVEASKAPILVLEESGPVVEEFVRAHAGGHRVMGRYTGHVPWAGPIDVAVSIAAAIQDEPLPPAKPEGSHWLPAGDLTPFGTLWTVAAELGLTPIAVDAGHCGLAVFLDDDPAPFSYGLGSAISVAAGIALARNGPAIAVTGDMGAWHAGLLALLQVVRDQTPVIIFIEDDGAATTTGGQPTPSAHPGNGEREVSFARVAAAIGVDHVETVKKEQMNSEFIRTRLQTLSAARGPSVVIIDERSATPAADLTSAGPEGAWVSQPPR